jgi:hypothetical protein
MPRCPTCNAAVWVGQQHCTTCCQPLPPPEGENYLCPQCGLSLATSQEICQKCNPSPAEITAVPIMAPAKAWRPWFKILGLSMGAGLIVVGLLLAFPFKKTIPPTHPPIQKIMIPAAPVVPAPTHTAAPIPAADNATPAPTVAAVQEITTPAAPATSPPPAVTPSPASFPRYFVNNNGLSIREDPDISAPLVGTLKYKDEVELLETSGGWGKVRDVKRNIVGWSYMRYLQPVEADESEAVSRHQAAVSKEPEPIAAKDSENM